MTEEKKLFKIGYITKLLGITSRTIRYYEQFGLLPHVKRTDGQIRLFSEEDLELIKKIRRMQKEEFLPLEIIKEKLLGKKGNDSKCNNKVVLTDSTATIPLELLDKLNIKIIPLSIKIGEEIIIDTVKISPVEIWEKSKAISKSIKTQPVSVEDFVAKYLELAAEGYTEVYSVHLSEKFSLTISNAIQAANKVSDRITVTVIDSRSVGAGLGLLTQVISEAVYKNETKEQIDLLIQKSIPMVFDIMVLNSMHFMVSASKLQAPDTTSIQDSLSANLFKFKPILQLTNGELNIIECCKEKSRALSNMLELLNKEIQVRGGYVRQITIIYNHLYGEALDIINKIKQKYSNTPIYMNPGSAVVSAYVGPESIGISII